MFFQSRLTLDQDYVQEVAAANTCLDCAWLELVVNP